MDRVLGIALIAVGSFCIAGGCSSPWDRYEDSLYEALKVPQPEVYARHADLLRGISEYYEAEARKPPPGVLAECGLYLARLGRIEEARRYLRAETEAYPESAVFMAALERAIEGHGAFTPKT